MVSQPEAKIHSRLIILLLGALTALGPLMFGLFLYGVASLGCASSGSVQ
jgi:hypothetical protein